MSWYANAVAIIATIHESLPADADLKARRKALRDAKPYHYRTTSWGRKTWAKAARTYLDRYDARSPRGWEGLPFDGSARSPLGRKKAAAAKAGAA